MMHYLLKFTILAASYSPQVFWEMSIYKKWNYKHIKKDVYFTLSAN